MLESFLLGILPMRAASDPSSHIRARDRLLRLVTEHPGLPVGELGRRLGIGAGTLHYHLERAKAAGEIAMQRAGRRSLVFPATQTTEAARVEAMALLGGKTVLAIARHIASHPGCSLIDVIGAVGGSPRVVYYHVRRLREGGLVRSASTTRYRDLRPSPLLYEILTEWGRAGVTPDG